MTTKVQEIAEQVKALPEKEREEFLSWLADFEIEHADEWDKQIADDSQKAELDRRLAERASSRSRGSDWAETKRRILEQS